MGRKGLVIIHAMSLTSSPWRGSPLFKIPGRSYVRNKGFDELKKEKQRKIRFLYVSFFHLSGEAKEF
jgi:hypothetical protein